MRDPQNQEIWVNQVLTTTTITLSVPESHPVFDRRWFPISLLPLSYDDRGLQPRPLSNLSTLSGSESAQAPQFSRLRDQIVTSWDFMLLAEACCPCPRITSSLKTVCGNMQTPRDPYWWILVPNPGNSGWPKYCPGILLIVRGWELSVPTYSLFRNRFSENLSFRFLGRSSSGSCLSK